MDLYSDIYYFQTVPKSSSLLQFVMIASLILPHILNLLWLSWKVGSESKSWLTGIGWGLFLTVLGFLGLHDLFIPIY